MCLIPHSTTSAGRYISAREPYAEMVGPIRKQGRAGLAITAQSAPRGAPFTQSTVATADCSAEPDNEYRLVAPNYDRPDPRRPSRRRVQANPAPEVGHRSSVRISCRAARRSLSIGMPAARNQPSAALTVRPVLTTSATRIRRLALSSLNSVSRTSRLPIRRGNRRKRLTWARAVLDLSPLPTSAAAIAYRETAPRLLPAQSE